MHPEINMLPTSTFAHSDYFRSYYPMVLPSGHFIDGPEMQERWEFRDATTRQKTLDVSYEGVSVDSGSCDSASLWLMASVTMALHEFIVPEHVFSLLATTFDETLDDSRRSESYSNGPQTGRLEADLKYWNSFARSRGLDSGIERAKVSLDHIPKSDHLDLCNLLLWMYISHGYFGGVAPPVTCNLRLEGLAWHVVQHLEMQGLKINCEDGAMDDNIKNVVVYCKACRAGKSN